MGTTREQTASVQRWLDVALSHTEGHTSAVMTDRTNGATAVTTLDENKTIARRWLDLISAHQLEELCAITPPTWRMHGGPPDLPPGPEGVRALFATFGTIEQTWTVEDEIAEGDRVVIRATNRCLQDSFFGIPSRGRWQTFSATFVFRIEQGQAAEIWRNADDLGRLLQLGARLVRDHPAAGEVE